MTNTLHIEGDNRKIILFDGVCNLCNGIVKFMIKRDPNAKFKFASLQSETGQSLLKQFGLPSTHLNSFVYIKANKAFIKSTAGLEVAKDLDGFWKVVYLLIVVPKPIRDFIYDLIAKSRYKLFGKKDSCMLPSAEMKQRFL